MSQSVPSGHHTHVTKVGNFFHSYAKDFDSIYTDNSFKNRWRQFIDRQYRSSMSDRYHMTMQCLLEKDIESILDVGCGPGRYIFDLAREGKKITAIDIAQAMIDLSKENLEKGEIPLQQVTFKLGAYLELDLKSKHDAAILMGFFDYTPDPLSVVKKLKTEINHFFVASFPDYSGPLAWQRKIRYMARNCPLYLYSREDLEAILKEAGINKFEIIPLHREFFVRAWPNQ